MDTHALSPTRRNLHVLGWAAYLACSWTWCIGMFLPTLLARDYGPWSFAVFAIPNVLGAAAMGWVLARPDAPARLAHTHAGATSVFSLVTIAFQMWFLHWASPALRVPMGAIVAACVLLPLVIRMLLGRLSVQATVAGAVALLLSLIALAWMLADGQTTLPFAHGSRPHALLWLAPVCLFGFALCPYLDRTFLLAASQLPPARRRAAFTIGFVAFFTPMIVMTLLYADWLRPRVLTGATDVLSSGARAIVALHILVQLLFTIVAHLVVLARPITTRPHAQPFPIRLLTAVLASVLIAALVQQAGTLLHRAPLGVDTSAMSPGELSYRLFMGFYALAFPAYAWICMIPTRGGHAGLTGPLGRVKLITTLAAIILAGPAMWMGMIAMDERWIPASVLIVLLARVVPMLLARRITAETDATPR
ncbi:MAG: hypothetical protein RBS39_03050 [Phycisphaerales bacterium]|jgi:hypothetical protein|nr:hypothetical protein [Phycisphaerales bacterium]